MYFSWSPRKVPKEGDSRGHSEKACPLENPLRRLASQHPKMFRFLDAYNSKIGKLSLCRHPKIGTFSGVGWSCGGGFLRGRIFVAPLKPLSLVTFLAAKKVTSPHFLIYRKVWLFATVIMKHHFFNFTKWIAKEAILLYNNNAFLCKNIDTFQERNIPCRKSL